MKRQPQLLFSLNHWANQTRAHLRVVTFFAKWLLFILIAIGLGVHWYEAGLSQAWLVVGAAAVAWVANVLIGNVVKRPRPSKTHARIKEVFAPMSHWKSFPSDHTALASVVAFSVFSIYPLLGWGLLALALSIGLSRVAAGLHYGSDIVGGAFVGLAITLIFGLLPLV